MPTLVFIGLPSRRLWPRKATRAAMAQPAGCARRFHLCWWLVGMLPATGANAAATDWLPDTPLTPPLVADSRETFSSVTVRSGDPRVDTTVADRVGIVRWEAFQWQWQVDLAAGLFLGFDPGGELTFGMQTVDGLIRLPLSVRQGPFSASLEWAHVSAHYADGIRKATDEPLPDRMTYSREYLRLQASRAFGWFEPYLAWRQIIHSLPESAAPGFQVGYQIHLPGPVPLYHGVDLKLNADQDWQPSLSGQLGFAFQGAGPRVVHLGVVAMTGPDDTGQKAGENDHFIGGQLGFQRHPEALDP